MNYHYNFFLHLLLYLKTSRLKPSFWKKKEKVKRWNNRVVFITLLSQELLVTLLGKWYWFLNTKILYACSVGWISSCNENMQSHQQSNLVSYFWNTSSVVRFTNYCQVGQHTEVDIDKDFHEHSSVSEKRFLLMIVSKQLSPSKRERKLWNKLECT